MLGIKLVGWHINQGPDKEARFVTQRKTAVAGSAGLSFVEIAV